MVNSESARSKAPLINSMRMDEESAMLSWLPIKKDSFHPTRMQLIVACIASCVLVNIGYAFGRSSAPSCQDNAIVVKHASNDPCLDKPPRNQGIPTFMSRADLGNILEAENMTIGAELGVQRGIFANTMLSRWPSNKEYVLVDVWAPQENYAESANVDQTVQNAYYHETLANTNLWKEKIRVCRNFTSVCVENFPDGYFDFVYVDARHDFKGAYEDLEAWWPKIRVGGIMAGHDYVTQDDGPTQNGDDWTINYDGTVDETRTVAKGAVDKFSKEVCRQLTIAYREPNWNTWAMRK